MGPLASEVEQLSQPLRRVYRPGKEQRLRRPVRFEGEECILARALPRLAVDDLVGDLFDREGIAGFLAPVTVTEIVFQVSLEPADELIGGVLAHLEHLSGAHGLDSLHS